MKHHRICPKCDGRRIGRFDFVPGTYQPGPHTYLSQYAAVLADRSAARRAFGELEAYLCGTCGFYELYVKDINEIPFEKLAGFEWLGEAPGGPYRS